MDSITQTEALLLAHEISDRAVITGDRQSLIKLRRLKSLLASRPEGHGDVTEDYRREAMDQLTGIGFMLMNRDASVAMDDESMKDLALRIETAAARIHRYLDVKRRADGEALEEAAIRG